MGMETHADLSPFPHRSGGSGMAGMAMGGDAPAAAPAARVAVAFSMWWVMMVAMMLPAAAPVILLYAKAVSSRGAEDKPATRSFLAGYLAVWGAFSLLAAALQAGLERLALLAPMTMGSGGRWFSAAVLVAAGLYQLSPLKEACLSRCRNPAVFLTRHYRPGRAGAFRLGLLHGAYCVGCCWLLMALLFVGGVMNLAWIALLTLLVAAEKLLPGGRRVAVAAGLAFIGWGAVTALA
jgi:predicted metal-binding membrane protein